MRLNIDEKGFPDHYIPACQLGWGGLGKAVLGAAGRTDVGEEKAVRWLLQAGWSEGFPRGPEAADLVLPAFLLETGVAAPAGWNQVQTDWMGADFG